MRRQVGDLRQQSERELGGLCESVQGLAATVTIFVRALWMKC